MNTDQLINAENLSAEHCLSMFWAAVAKLAVKVSCVLTLLFAVLQQMIDRAARRVQEGCYRPLNTLVLQLLVWPGWTVTIQMSPLCSGLAVPI